MAVCAPSTVTTVLRCQACGAQVDFRSRITETHRQPGSVTFTVATYRDDLPWLYLFDEAHAGPIERVR